MNKLTPKLLIIATLILGGCDEYADRPTPSKVPGYHWTKVYRGDALVRNSDGLIMGKTTDYMDIGACLGQVNGTLVDHEYIDCARAKAAMEGVLPQ